MALPRTIVELGLDLSSVGGPFFQLGSGTASTGADAIAANPQSIFDNTTYRFGGTLFYDVTSRVASVSTNRGRSRDLDKTLTGSANITFRNQDRAFDPFYTSSPYYPDIKPRRDIRISTVTATGTVVQFTGLVEDWALDYNVNGESDAYAACVDGFILFGGQQLSAHTATAQKSGARIDAILSRSEVNWPSTLRDIDTGAQTLSADVVEQGREVLEYLQLVETSEPGFLFMSKTNKVTFRNRNATAAAGTIILSDAGTAIPYTDLSVSYGTELLYNRASVGGYGLDPQTSVNASSTAVYGVVSLDLNGLLISSSTDTAALAAYIVRKYANPELRFDTITVDLAPLSTSQQDQILGIELGNIIQAEFRPNKIGNRITKNVSIISIAHSIQPDSHRVTFGLAATDTIAMVFAGGTVSSGAAVQAAYPFSGFAGGTYAGQPLGL